MAIQEYLAFRLGTEEYGIDILKVQEIRGYEAVTAIANSPPHLKGVINLRGIIVPIIDMRICLGVGAPVYNALTVVIILAMGEQIVGMVVDSVSDVVGFSDEQIKPPPQMGTAFNTDYLTGLATLGERMLILVNIEQLMAEAFSGVEMKQAA